MYRRLPTKSSFGDGFKETSLIQSILSLASWVTVMWVLARTHEHRQYHGLWTHLPFLNYIEPYNMMPSPSIRHWHMICHGAWCKMGVTNSHRVHPCSSIASRSVTTVHGSAYTSRTPSSRPYCVIRKQLSSWPLPSLKRYSAGHASCLYYDHGHDANFYIRTTLAIPPKHTATP